MADRRLSPEARVWERRMLCELHLEDVAWNPLCCCPSCLRPGCDEDAPEEDIEPAPRSGVVVRLAVEVVDRRWAASAEGR